MLRSIAPILAVLIYSCLAFGQTRPVCNAENAGRMWPEAANHDRALVGRLARCGELEMCSRGVWRYAWRPLTVRLGRSNESEVRGKPTGCAAPVAASEPIAVESARRP